MTKHLARFLTGLFVTVGALLILDGLAHVVLWVTDHPNDGPEDIVIATVIAVFSLILLAVVGRLMYALGERLLKALGAWSQT